jgi:hypothetical protein
MEKSAFVTHILNKRRQYCRMERDEPSNWSSEFWWSQQHKYLPPFHLRTETDAVSVRSCILKYRRMDNFQELRIPKCYTPLSVRIRIYYFPSVKNSIMYKYNDYYNCNIKLLHKWLVFRWYCGSVQATWSYIHRKQKLYFLVHREQNAEWAHLWNIIYQNSIKII